MLDELIDTVNSLECAIGIYEKRKNDLVNKNELRVLQAGIIKYFEFTYEFCWRIMKMWLEECFGSDYIEGLPQRNLFRLAVEKMLIDDVGKWMGFYEIRNFSFQTYDKFMFDEMFEYSLDFLPYAKRFMKRLKVRCG